MKFMNKILLFLVIAIFVAIPAFAQTGNIHGKVTDTDGKPMTGVTISIDRQGITQHLRPTTEVNTCMRVCLRVSIRSAS